MRLDITRKLNRVIGHYHRQSMLKLPETIKDLIEKDPDRLIGQEKVLNGWAKTCRTQKKGELLFIELEDGTTQKHIQVLLSKSDFDAKHFEELSQIKTGYSLKIVGKFVKSPAALQSVEVQASQVSIVGTCPSEYLLQKHSSKTKGITLEKLREHPHVRCRAEWFKSVTRIRSCLMNATHDFFKKHGFEWATTPIITFSDCEGAGEAFVVKTQYPAAELPEGGFFGKEASLTVSGQLEGEMLATASSRIYTFGPTFRAEKSNTSRHLSEFWMIEPEICFIDLETLIALACEYLRYCIEQVLTHNTRDIERTLRLSLTSESEIQDRIAKLTSFADSSRKPIVISYTKAIELLIESKVSFENRVEWGIDMSSEHEKYLTDVIFKSPVVVHSYPANIKAFYMKKYTSHDNNDRITKCVQAFDLLVPGIGELIGGSMREHDYDTLTKVMTEKRMDLSQYDKYLDLRRFGTVPHGGFGLGFERLVQFVSGVKHIQDTIPFPRSY